jgi:hypothetical protein
MRTARLTYNSRSGIQRQALTNPHLRETHRASVMFEAQLPHCALGCGACRFSDGGKTTNSIWSSEIIAPATASVLALALQLEEESGGGRGCRKKLGKAAGQLKTLLEGICHPKDPACEVRFSCWLGRCFLSRRLHSDETERMSLAFEI